jgi:hypothetical protein
MKGFCLILASLAGLFIFAAAPSFADEIPQAGNRANLAVPPHSQGEALLKGGASGRKRGTGGRSPASSSAPVQVGGICPLPYGSTAHVGSAGYGACGQAKSDSAAAH